MFGWFLVKKQTFLLFTDHKKSPSSSLYSTQLHTFSLLFACLFFFNEQATHNCITSQVKWFGHWTILQLNNWTIEHTFRGSNVIQYYSRSCSKYIRSTKIFCASILRRLLESYCFLICLIQPQNIDKGKTIAAFDLF